MREPAPRFNARHHARLLVQSMYAGDEPLAPGEVLASALIELYVQMLTEMGWDKPLPWQSVGRHVKELLGNRKSYGTFSDQFGRKRRLRIYVFPEVSPLNESTAESALASAA